MNHLYSSQSLREDVFEHLDMVFRSARRRQNHSVALKAIELALKAKRLAEECFDTFREKKDVSEFDLERLLEKLNAETS